MPGSSVVVNVFALSQAVRVRAAIDQLSDLESMVRFACLLAAAAGLLLAAQGIHALWHGERMFRTRITQISSIRPGHVVLSGIVEPAWSVLKSPFSDRLCVWYNGKSTTTGLTYRGQTLWDYRERNAVPFLLDDGTGRVLILGRRARWDSGNSRLDLGAADRAIRDGGGRAEIDPNRGELTPPPEPLFRMGKYPVDGPDQVVAVGERVTVVGRAAPDDGGVSPIDACPDSGDAFGLPGLYRVGPDGLWGLGVLAGSARDVTARGRLRLVLGMIGFALLIGCAATNVLLPSDHVLPSSGVVVFGTSFDPYAGVQGQTATFSSQQAIVAVAGLPGVGNADKVTIEVDGVAVTSWTASGLGSRHACEIDFPSGYLSPGKHYVEVLGDIFGTTLVALAVGTFTIGP